MFLPTKRGVSQKESVGANFLEKAGFVRQTSAGVYALLPLALRSIKKIEQIVREEMLRLGASELILPSLQTKRLWQQSGRWEDRAMKDILFRDNEEAYCFAPTHEEQITYLIREQIKSYRDLPLSVFQFQTKFRRELRPRSGLLRGREFIMKDLYSFHPDFESHQQFYDEVALSYDRVFNRLGLKTYRVKASGGVFGREFSDEFQVISEAGEDEILINEHDQSGFNSEIEDTVPKKDRAKLKRVRSIEVGNIFHLGTKYAEAYDLVYQKPDGSSDPVVMGSYGIGITRLLATLAEIYRDNDGLKLPWQVAPFTVQLIDLTGGKIGESLERQLEENSIEVLFDDRDESAGVKLVDADLIGLPLRLVYSARISQEGKVEVRRRKDGQVKTLPKEELVTYIKKSLDL